MTVALAGSNHVRDCSAGHCPSGLHQHLQVVAIRKSP